MLRELSDIVDTFFLIESNGTHKGVRTLAWCWCLTNISQMQKPLIWDLVKNTERFQFLSADQVKHIVINMTVSYEKQDGIWEE